MADPKPLLFVSHKHDDGKIGKVIADFVRTITGGNVDVHLSSDPDFEGPRVGKNINDELKTALWHAGVVILVYTSQDNDWSYCMWECGLADEAKSPDTKVIVLQCLRDKPKVFEGGRVRAWDEGNLVQLAYRFAEEDFFPGAGGKVSGLRRPELKDRAQVLHKALLDVIPKEPPENWSVWPFMRLSLARETVDGILDKPTNEQVDATVEAMLDDGRVTIASSGLAQLFGKVDVPPGSSLRELVDDWRASYPGRVADWLEVAAAQVVEGAKKKNPKVKSWAHFRQTDGDSEFVLGVGRVKKDEAKLEFDCYFLGLGQVPGVETRMNSREKMYYIDLAKKKAETVLLVDLLSELEDRKWTRIPILDGDEAKYIVHVSMVDRFLRLAALEGKDVKQLTLADILQNKDMESMFSKTFAVVDTQKTIADALLAMTAIDGCEDVFVTEGGSVIGWITDRDIPIRDLRAP